MHLKMEERLCRIAVSLVLYSFLTLQGNCAYIEPDSVDSIILRTSGVTASSVQGDSDPCVAGTTVLPAATDVLASQPANVCNNTDSIASLPDSSKSYIFVSNTSTCVFNHTVASSVSPYTVAFWIRQTCVSCDLLLLNSATVHLRSNKLQISGTDYYDINVDKWHHITIRKEESGVSLYVDGKYVASLSGLQGSLTNIQIKPSVVSGELILSDFRYYRSYLTDRQITVLFSRMLPSTTILESQCRCPDYYPTLNVTDDDPSGLMCKSYVQNKGSAGRLNPSSHVPELVLDQDASTSWKSQNVSVATITINFDSIFMIDNISTSMTGSVPVETTIQLKVNNDVKNNVMLSNDRNPSWNADPLSSSSDRSLVEKSVANTIMIRFDGHSAGYNFFEVTEIQVMGRCYCNGNSDQCQLQGRTFNCTSCQDSEGQFCQSCTPGKYRDTNGFQCTNDCACSNIGTKSTALNICAVDGGQCDCKDNVNGTTCDTCKHLTYNLQAHNTLGCAPCDCDQNGTASCGETSGTCTCKPNVKPGRCEECTDKYYGRQLENGCVPCNCDSRGIQSSDSCDEFSGQCQCKAKVTGRQCNTCMDGFYDLSSLKTAGCTACRCNKIGSVNNQCDKTSGQCSCYTGSNDSPKCDPVIRGGIVPSFGPLSGQTTVRIRGSLFGLSSSKVMVNMNSGKFFNVSSFNDTGLTFLTPSHSQAEAVTFNVRWSDVRFDATIEDLLVNFTYNYKLDPSIAAVTNMSAFISGGCSLVVPGANFDSVFQPRLIVYNSLGQEINRTVCTSQGTQLACKTPHVSNIQMATYGFHFDGFTNYKNLSGMFSDSHYINFIKDPHIQADYSVGEFRPVFDKTIQIQGIGFETGCSRSDFRVQIGRYGCTITSLTNTLIECEPQIDFPGPGESFQLQVIIGDSVYFVKYYNLQNFWSTKEFIGIAVGGSVFIILVIFLIVLFRCCRSRKSRIVSKKERAQSVRMSEVRQNSDRVIVPERQRARPNSYTGVKLNKELWENFVHRINESVRKDIEFSKIDMSEVRLGSRCTNKGEDVRLIDGSFADNTGKVTAGRSIRIKTLVNDFDRLDTTSGLLPQWVSNGIQECLKFRDCYDDNFLPIQGITADEKRFYAIYPVYNRIFKDHLNDSTQQNTLENLLQWCMQVADGVAFLHNNMDIIHKDLATRNCIVTEDNIVKITDSSFSWNLYADEYMYDETREKFMPVRWMSMESLSSGFYDRTTDMWSFGILAWEIMCLASCLPYSDVQEDRNVQSHVLEGYRLGKSDNTPESLYTLLSSCWEAESDRRPMVDDVQSQLKAIISGDVADPDSVYMNLYENQDTLDAQGAYNAGYQQ